MTEDEYVTRCEAEHTDGPADDCLNCDVRKTRDHCELCPAEWEDGQLITRGSMHGPHVLFDDWDGELLCSTMGCGDPVETPGAIACDFHQREIDAVETGKVYQRLVAQR